LSHHEVKGLKTEYKTKARALIMEFLKKNSEKRFTAAEVFENVNKSPGGMNLTTVYRNLDRLCEQGELIKFQEPSHDAWYYQYSDEHRHCDLHMHAKCSQCGKIFHLENEFVEEFEEKMSAYYGIDVDTSKTIIVGRCKECQETV
jgi:Fe2+/Zn2+ uptake regulation proteins